MILTITANTTMDVTYSVDELRPGRQNADTTLSIGAKPTDASYILAQLGISSRALGFAGGVFGEWISDFLSKAGVEVDFIRVAGETRLGANIVNRADGTHYILLPDSLRPTSEDVERLREQVYAALPDTEILILGGTLPQGMSPDFYTDIISAAKKQGVFVIFDAHGEFLRAGLKSGPDFIKPNEIELSAYSGRPVESAADAYREGRAIYEATGVCPIISMGKLGALAILADRAYTIPAIEVSVGSTVGAGDAMLAGMAAARYRGQSAEEGLRLGMALASAVVIHPGTAQFDPADVERFLPQIQLIPYSG